MKVELIIMSSDSEYERRIDIRIDGKEVFSVWDGEPEDNTTHRNFNDVMKIPELLLQVHNNAKAGGTLEIIQTTSEWK